MEDSTKTDVIKHSILDPALAHNYRGQLAAALRILDFTEYGLLLCDYAEHVAWIYEEITENDSDFRKSIHAVREFLKDVVTIHNVGQSRSKLYGKISELKERSISQMDVVMACFDLARMTMGACCQRQLEEAKYMAFNKYQPNAIKVASQASFVVALYVGGQEWDSSSKSLKAMARKRGHEASEEETQWQIQKLLDYVEENGKPVQPGG